MLHSPFDSLGAVTHGIMMYKEGFTIRQIAKSFAVSEEVITIMLQHFYTSPHVKKVIPKVVVPDKYKDLFDEPINKGHSYSWYLKKSGQKISSAKGINLSRCKNVDKSH